MAQGFLAIRWANYWSTEPFAPDAISSSRIWTLPAADGTDGQVLKTNGSGVLSWVSSLAPSGAASGDLSGSYPGPTVVQVGGVSAASLASGAIAANNATAVNTPSRLVSRDSLGNFEAGIITATLNGNATNVTGTIAVSNGGTGATTASGAFETLSPLSTQGDILYAGAGGIDTRPKTSVENVV